MRRILYVEDNEDNVYMLSRRLRKYGYNVLVASDGKHLRKPQCAELAYREDRSERRLGWCRVRSCRAQRGLPLRADFRADGDSSVSGTGAEPG